MVVKGYFFLLATIVMLHRVASQDEVGDALSFAGFVATLAVAVYDARRELYAGISGQPDLASLSRIAADVRRIDAAFGRMRDQLGDASPVLNLVTTLSENVELELKMRDISEWMQQVDAMYDQMQTYMQEPSNYANVSIEDFAVHCVSHDSKALGSVIEGIHDGIIGSEPEDMTRIGILTIFRNNLMESSLRNVCEYGQSPYQLIYNLMDTIIMAEIKGYATMQYAWMLLKIYGHGDFNVEVENAKYKYVDRINATVMAFENSLENISREIVRCDDDNPVEGTTYERITNFRQGYIENEINMDKDKKCDSKCASLKIAKQRRCTNHTLCEKQPKCNGVLNSCREIDRGSNPQMTICLSPKGSTRLYDWIEYDNGIVNGAVGVCKTKRYRMDSSWTQWFSRCAYCACICDNKGGPNSDRYFSLKQVIAEIRDNKIVTGLRFIKVDRILHLQISQGTLLPNGIVDANVTWIPIERIDIKNEINGVDFHELTYKERRIDLDDLEGAPGSVLTGVRFKKIKGRLNFQIQSTPFDYRTGRLMIDRSAWINSRRSRTRITTENQDVPTRSRMKSTPDSRSGQYIEFDHTDFELDFAQTTIPYIDTQPVVSSIPGPLAGAGLYHKGTTGFGGYIAPKIITYNHNRHIMENFANATNQIYYITQ